MRPCILTCAVLLTLAAPARAQQPAPDDVLSAYLRRSYAAVSKDLMAAVETMPEKDFGFRPAGAIEKVRTFGEIALHLVAANSWVCFMGEPKSTPAPAFDPALATDKARLVAVMKEVDARCTASLETLKDAELTRVITSGTAERPLQAVRGHAVIFAIAHSNEHYGNLVSYLRAKGLVPPAAASQAMFLSPVREP